jgi:hypothetical protein
MDEKTNYLLDVCNATLSRQERMLLVTKIMVADKYRENDVFTVIDDALHVDHWKSLARKLRTVDDIESFLTASDQIQIGV